MTTAPDLSAGLCHATITTRAEALRRDPVIFPHETSSRVIQQRKLAEQAAAFCWGCPVAAPCLSYALDTGDSGVWGGTSTHQRINLRRRTRRHNRQDPR